MLCYKYQCIDSKGRIYNGSIMGHNKEEAASKIQARGEFILSLQRDYVYHIKNNWCNGDNQLEKLLLFRKLSVMLKAGISLSDAILIIGNSKGKIQSSLQEIYANLRKGNSFSNSLAEVNMFPSYVIAAIRAGESGGALEEILEKQTENISRNYESREKIKTAMLYPIILLLASAILVSIMLIMVLPVFAQLFKGMDVPLPLPTQIVLFLSDFISKYAYWLPVIFFILILFGVKLWMIEKIRLSVCGNMLKIPLLGRIMYLADLRQWLETLSLLLASGMLLTDSVNISADVIENPYLKWRFKALERQLHKGNTLYLVGVDCGCIEPMVLDLINAGESSGELERMLNEASVICERESDTLLKRLEVMIEPVTILCIGIVTGFLVISILLPIMEMMTMYS